MQNATPDIVWLLQLPVDRAPKTWSCLASWSVDIGKCPILRRPNWRMLLSSCSCLWP